MTMKVYGVAMSTCTSHVLTCIHEKDIEFEFVPVDMTVGEHKQLLFLSKNIPALEDGDLTLFESRAMTRDLATKHKDSGTYLLKLEDLKESTLVNAWLEVEAHQYCPVISPIVYQRVVIPVFYGGSPDEEVIKSNAEKLRKVLDVYEDKLSKTKYLTGDFYSLADVHHLSYTFYLMKTPEAELVNSRLHVKAWWEDISSRPAFKKVVENMTLTV